MDKRSQPDFVLFAVTLVLLGIGAVMIYSASAPTAEARFGSSMFFFNRHVVRVLMGLGVMAAMTTIDYHLWSRKRILFFVMAGTVGLLLLLFIPGLPFTSGTIKGATRWLHLGPLTLQPSEVAKLAVVIYLANSLAKRQGYIDQFSRGVLPPFLVLCAFSGLVLLERDFKATATLFMIGITLLYIGRTKLKHLLLLGSTTMAALVLSVVMMPYRFQRVTDFLDSEKDVQGGAYQAWQSLIGLGSGGLWGVGLGQGRQKLQYLPEAHTDFIFSIIGEEFGFVGTIAVMALFLTLLWRGIRIAKSAPDLFGAYLAFGISFMIFSIGLVHIGVACNVLPTTGMPLPFISYGGSSVLLCLAGIGILLNISRQPGEMKVAEVTMHGRLKVLHG